MGEWYLRRAVLRELIEDAERSDDEEELLESSAAEHLQELYEQESIMSHAEVGNKDGQGLGHGPEVAAGNTAVTIADDSNIDNGTGGVASTGNGGGGGDDCIGGVGGVDCPVVLNPNAGSSGRRKEGKKDDLAVGSGVVSTSEEEDKEDETVTIFKRVEATVTSAASAVVVKTVKEGGGGAGVEQPKDGGKNCEYSTGMDVDDVGVEETKGGEKEQQQREHSMVRQESDVMEVEEQGAGEDQQQQSVKTRTEATQGLGQEGSGAAAVSAPLAGSVEPKVGKQNRDGGKGSGSRKGKVQGGGDVRAPAPAGGAVAPGVGGRKSSRRSSVGGSGQQPKEEKATPASKVFFLILY